MKILIIGSKGFIGNAVYQFYQKQSGVTSFGCDVVVDYVDKAYFLIDGTNSDFHEIFEHTAFDVCVNCSGAASVPDSILHPIRDYTLNTLNVIKILDSIKKYRPACKLINMSSAAVYGNPESLPINETFKCAPVSPYGLHKLYAEQLCTEYSKYFGINVCSLRIFSAYGPGLRKQLLWDIYQKSLNKTTINLFGTGDETRDYIFVDDIVNAIDLVINNGDFNAGIYNLANGIELSTKTIAQNLLNALLYNGELTFSGENRSGDPLCWRADITKLSGLGYKPSVSIENGIQKYVQWLKK